MGPNKRVLVVDDESENLDLYRRVLGGEFEVDTVQSGEEGLERLSESAYQVIISDKRMPGMSGTDFLGNVQERAPGTVRLLVTAYPDLDDTIDAVNEAGISAILHKPFEPRELLAKVRAAVTINELTVRNSDLVKELEETNRVLEQRTAEIQRTQAELMQADRLASLGTLATGVSHEINNPLAFVLANLDAMREEWPALLERVARCADSQPPGSDLEKVAATLRGYERLLTDAGIGAARIKEIVGDLRMLGSPDDRFRDPVDVRAVIESSISLAWSQLKKRAQVVRRLNPVPPVTANETRLAQVILNLLINAAHAIKDGNSQENTITVSTWQTDAGEVAFEVRDTGVGMSKETLDQVFLPFFSTKGPRIGTGLGLAICERIVTDLDGTIEAESEPGVGTAFRITLPACFPLVDTGTRAQAGDQPTHEGRILIVNDEPRVARALSTLVGSRHDFTLATSAQEALDLLASGAEFEVVFCDLLMPNMNGIELYRAVLDVNPAMAERFVFMSGSSGRSLQTETFFSGVANPRIDKPFDMRTVRELVSSLLAARN